MSLTTEPRRNEETDDTGKYQASELPVQQHITPVDPSMDRVCSALYALRQLVPAGSAIPRPFVFLGIDQNAAPFSPAADSAYPGSSMHREARRAVLDALGRMQASIAPAVARGDSGAEKVWVASVLVGYMLLDDAARALFLSTVDPKMKAGQGSWLFGLVGGGRGDEDAGVVCDEIWERMGWSRTSSSRLDVMLGFLLGQVGMRDMV
ncbi:LOW QUALITY PROTEIN: hypothetical protein ColTof4_14439 [Colletotrichum tofieldiae]|nr:LOW QUALITY PROTEIN: hypothetical protein ColTof3_14839 [Colletotrichum tofieldiae]GKT82016.1 LOW QUALITY PROTEIN: hypothetical protein ColTof4_14439 [Colletotrichum tofieldiae]